MTFFTDSPFERMMVQKPQYRREERPPAPQKGRLNYGLNDIRSCWQEADGKIDLKLKL